jgi:rhamnogalacturonyl hydrolase YesR
MSHQRPDSNRRNWWGRGAQWLALTSPVVAVVIALVDSNSPTGKVCLEISKGAAGGAAVGLFLAAAHALGWI